MTNQVSELLELLVASKVPFAVVTNPRETETISDKLQLMDDYPFYAKLGSVRVLKGSILQYGGNVIAYFSPGETRIQFRQLRRQLQVPKKQDLTFYQGDISLYAAEGAVSPFTISPENLNAIYFSTACLDDSVNKGLLHEMPVSKKQSVVCELGYVFGALAVLYDNVRCI